MHNFKKTWKIIAKSLIFICILIVLNETFRFIVMPPSYARYILGELNSKNDYNCIILGASHGRSAINPYKLDEILNCNAINMSIPSETIKDSYYLLKESCQKNNPKTIILDIDYQYWYKLARRQLLALGVRPKDYNLDDQNGSLEFTMCFGSSTTSSSVMEDVPHLTGGMVGYHPMTEKTVVNPEEGAVLLALGVQGLDGHWHSWGSSWTEDAAFLVFRLYCE